MEKLLDVTDLKTHFHTSEGILPAVDGVTFHVNRGETLGLVGESGCGKSVVCLSVMRLVPSPPGRHAGGEIVFGGRDLLSVPDEEMRRIRGNEIGMVFQEPMTSLNPVYTVGEQIAESIRLHQGLKPKIALAKAEHMLFLVGVPAPARRIHEYPHQLSGGLRQRVMIAMALSCNPKLLIADEPTTALDVTIQAQILDLMRGLKRELHMAILLITHDLGVVAEMAERVVVMYAGKLVEEAPVRELFRRPLHPYTEGLLTCIPRLDRPAGRLNVIKGVIPNPLDYVPGCRFRPRCPYVVDVCRNAEPPLVTRGERRVACHLADASERIGGSTT